MTDRGHASARDRLRAAVEHAAHVLPAQGPIGVFVHHNTLHAYEDRPFERAVVEAAEHFGAEPYMPEAWYRDRLGEGRIRPEDVDAILQADPDTRVRGDEPVLGGKLPRRGLRRLLLLRGIVETDDASVRWLLEEEGWIRRFARTADPATTTVMRTDTQRWWAEVVRTHPAPVRLLDDPFQGDPAAVLVRRWLGVPASRRGLEDALAKDATAVTVASLWAATARRTFGRPRPGTPRSTLSVERPRDVLLRACGRDADAVVLPILIPFLSAFLDQGIAYWPMPDREGGLYAAFRSLVSRGRWVPVPGAAELRALLQRQAEAGLAPEDVVIDALEAMAVPPERWADMLGAVALSLPGWAGMVRKLEHEPELAPHVCPPCRLVDYFAVRLTLDRWAAERIARRELAHAGPLATLLQRLPGPRAPEGGTTVSTVFAVFQVAQLAGLSTPAMLELDDRDLVDLLDELVRFCAIERRRLLHLAYERRHRHEVLEAIAVHRRSLDPLPAAPDPHIQVLTCIDEREESLRRHLEEVDPGIETLGTAGYFGVAISYRGFDDAHPAPLCPVVQKPGHAIEEVPDEAEVKTAVQHLARRKLFAALAWGGFVGSRALVRGFFATAGLGLLSMFPLVARVLWPGRVARIEERLRAGFFPRPRTRLAIRRKAEERGSLDLFPGFTPEEMADRVQRVLEETGLAGRSAPLVAVIGHGSSSLNNPHESAHDCGACGGRHGGPNARLFALMANDPQVRDILQRRGLVVGASTVFVGGFHNSCNDAVELYDLDEVPESHRGHLARLCEALDRARTLSAHERCRRFDSVPLDVTPTAALRHVEARASDLAQPRPEYGHATNAVCIFGRRAITRGLFLDRRAFLVSYDPTTDPDAEILGHLLASAGPVGAGISLEYYFSFVDNERYGCGTKLPHNVTGLIGVMNGHQSDLRTGLPWQMVEIHEPVRLLVVVETTEENLAKALERHRAVADLVRNAWIQLALVHPHTGRVSVHTGGRFEPFVPRTTRLPRVARSIDWYRGRRDHLPIAVVEAAMARQAPSLS